MVIKRNKIWILTADQAKAKVFEWIPQPKGLKEIVSLNEEDARKRERELKSDRPGHGHGQGPNSKSNYAVEERSSFKQQASDELLKNLASFLADQDINSSFDKLVVVAPAKVYNTLKQNLPANVQDKIDKHMAKNLTNMPTPDLVDYYVEQLA